MDNRLIDVTSEGDKALALAIELIWPNAAGGKASHYRIAKLSEQTKYYVGIKDNKPFAHDTNNVLDVDGTETLILYWNNDKETQSLPYDLNLEEAIEFIKGWLKKANYKSEPGHDGSNKKGWRVFNEDWGHVIGSGYAILAVQPAWAMYGK